MPTDLVDVETGYEASMEEIRASWHLVTIPIIRYPDGGTQEFYTFRYLIDQRGLTFRQDFVLDAFWIGPETIAHDLWWVRDRNEAILLKLTMG